MARDPDERRVGKPRDTRAVRVAARVAAFKDEKTYAENVMPLNPGFFALQRMRDAKVAKKRAAGREKPRSG